MTDNVLAKICRGREAFREGSHAYMSGFQSSSNPYGQGATSRGHWGDGWNREERLEKYLKATAKPKKPDGPTRDEVRTTLRDFAALEGKDAAITILKKVSESSSIGELDEDKFAAVIAACE